MVCCLTAAKKWKDGTIKNYGADGPIYASVYWPINAPDMGLSPGRNQITIQTNAGILLTGSSGTNFSESENAVCNMLSILSWW